MVETTEPTRLGAAMRREWIIIVVAVIIGLAAAYALAGTGSSSKWKGSETVRVTTLPGGLLSTQRAGLLVTAAGTSTVLRNAETALHLAHGTLNGTVSAAIAAADNSVMTISVTSSSRTAAVERAQAVTAAAVDYVLVPYGPYFDEQKTVVAAAEAEAAVLQSQIAALQKAMAAVPASSRAGYYSAIVAATTQRYNELSDATAARQRIQTIENSIYVQAPAHAGKTTTRMRLSTLAQGVLLGLVAGVVVAIVREWVRSRPVAASSQEA